MTDRVCEDVRELGKRSVIEMLPLLKRKRCLFWANMICVGYVFNVENRDAPHLRSQTIIRKRPKRIRQPMTEHYSSFSSKITKRKEILNSNRSMDLQEHALGNYDRPTSQPTDRPTDRQTGLRFQ